MPAFRGVCIPGEEEIMKELSTNAYYLRCRLMIRKNIKEGRGIGNVGDQVGILQF